MGNIAYFIFDILSATSNRVWTSSGSYNDTLGPSGLTSSWTVTVYGGTNQHSITANDPYLTLERGLFFDGHSSYLTVDGLVLPFSYFMNAWIRPLKSGTIYSGSDPNDGQV